MSDITQQQFDGIDFYPVVWPWSISVFTFYTLYTCIIIPLVIWRSDFHPLKSRSKGYLFVMIFTQYLMVTILSLRLIIGRQIFPCTLYYVFAFFGVPSFLIFFFKFFLVFMAPYLMQSFRLIMVTRLTHLKEEMVNFEIPEDVERKPTFFGLKKPLFQNDISFRKKSFIVPHTPTVPLQTPLPSEEMEEQTQMTKSLEPTTPTVTTMEKENVEIPDIKEQEPKLPDGLQKSPTVIINKRRKRKSVKVSDLTIRKFKMLKMYVSNDFLISIFILAMLFQGIMFMIFMTIYYNEIFLWAQGCVLLFYAGIVVVIFTVFYIGILAFLCVLLLFVKEEFKIRQELFFNMIIWSVFGLMWLLMALIPEWNRTYEYYFSAIWPIVFACFFSNFVAIAVPIIRTFKCSRKKKRENRESLTENGKLLSYMTYDHSKLTDDQNAKDFNSIAHLLAVLENSNANSFLGDYCKREWSSENFLFIEQLYLYKNLNKRSEQLYYGNLIYDTFLSRSASLELNISQRLRSAVRNKLDEIQKDTTSEELVESNLFSDVENSIINLMLDTWGRFLNSDLFQKMKEHLKKVENFENPNK
jgi:hypothetical protein